MEEMTEKEMKAIKMSTIYELRLLFASGDKNEYTKEEIVELLDKIATAKEQKQFTDTQLNKELKRVHKTLNIMRCFCTLFLKFITDEFTKVNETQS